MPGTLAWDVPSVAVKRLDQLRQLTAKQFNAE
jgi:hypothetical protein